MGGVDCGAGLWTVGHRGGPTLDGVAAAAQACGGISEVADGRGRLGTGSGHHSGAEHERRALATATLRCWRAAV